MKGLKFIAGLCLASLLALEPAHAASPDLRPAFQEFVVVQNARDLTKLKLVLLDSPDFLWVSGGVAIWGRDAALRRFAELYKGTWKLEPNMAAYRSQQLAADVAEIFVPILITVGPAGKPATKLKVLMNLIYIHVGNDWKLAKILPAPAAG
jgi:hypothetical protein